MDDADRTELNAAIAAHCEWLEQRGVRFLDPRDEKLSLPPDLLSAHDVMKALATRAPEHLVGAVLSSVHVLCSLRTRVTLSEARLRAVHDAAERLTKADYLTEEEKRRQLALISFVHEELHIKSLDSALKHVEKWLRTARRRLQEHVQQLEKRHEKAAKVGFLARSTADIALAQWMFSRSEALEDDFAFFRRHVEGDQFAAHKDELGAKAWRRALNAGLAALKRGDIKSQERRALFPGSFKKTTDPAEKGQQRGREYGARKRGEKRKESKM